MTFHLLAHSPSHTRTSISHLFISNRVKLCRRLCTHTHTYYSLSLFSQIQIVSTNDLEEWKTNTGEGSKADSCRSSATAVKEADPDVVVVVIDKDDVPTDTNHHEGHASDDNSYSTRPDDVICSICLNRIGKVDTETMSLFGFLLHAMSCHVTIVRSRLQSLSSSAHFLHNLAFIILRHYSLFGTRTHTHIYIYMHMSIRESVAGVGDQVMVTQQCEHVFHSRCLQEWMTNHSNACPFCRTTIVQPEHVNEVMHTDDHQ